MKKIALLSLIIVLNAFLSSCGFKAEDKNLQASPSPSKPAPPSPLVPTPDNKSQDPMASVATRRILESLAVETAKDVSQGQLVIAGMLTEMKPEDKEFGMLIYETDPKILLSRQMTEAELDLANSIFSNNTYINIGCSSISAAEIKGLTPVKTKFDTKTGFYHVHAKKVFVCTTTAGGSQAKGAIVTAEELTLSNSRSTFSKNGGLVSITAKVLKLHGENSLNTFTKIDGEMKPGSPILLNVLEKAEGDGKLFINK